MGMVGDACNGGAMCCVSGLNCQASTCCIPNNAASCNGNDADCCSGHCSGGSNKCCIATGAACTMGSTECCPGHMCTHITGTTYQCQ